MAEKTQKTKKGHKIPVPNRKDVLRDLKKVAKASERASRPAHRPQKH